MGIFAKPVVAIAFGAFMFCAETCLHADTLFNAAAAPLDLPYYDWTAAGFLLLSCLAVCLWAALIGERCGREVQQAADRLAAERRSRFGRQ